MNVETPQTRKEKLKKRLEKVLKQLPQTNWLTAFVHKYPAYAESKTHIMNVARGMSLDETVIERMEALAEVLKPTKVKLAPKKK